MQLLRPTDPWHPEVKNKLFASRSSQSALRNASRLKRLITKALTVLKRREYARAYVEIGAALQSYHWSSALHYCAGYAARKLGEFTLAQSHFAHVSNRNVLDALAAQEMMTLMYQMGRFQELSAFARCRLLDQEEAESYYVLGVVYQLHQQITNAQSAFEGALRCAHRDSPDHITYRLALSHCLYTQRHYAKALEYLSATEAGDHEEIQLWLLTGRCQFRLERRSEGEAALKRALKIDSSNILVHITYGDELHKTQPRRALKHYLKSIQRHQAPPVIYQRIATLYERLGELHQAIKYLETYRHFLEFEQIEPITEQIERLRRRLERSSARPWYKRLYERR